MKKKLILVSMFLLSIGLFNCREENKQTTQNDVDNEMLKDTAVYNAYLKTGAQYASQAGAALMKNVTEAITKGGTTYAIAYCNTNALPLTDSMAALNQTVLKRVSDKFRNPENKADSAQLAYIQGLKDRMAGGEKPTPYLTEINGKVVGYYPIVTNGLCMKCHGNKSEMDPATLAKINLLYPGDSATGYTVDQLRGLWIVTMDKKQP